MGGIDFNFNSPRFRHMMFSANPRGKNHVLGSMRGSLEAYRYLEPQVYDTAVRLIQEDPTKPLTRTERKALKAFLRMRLAGKKIESPATTEPMTPAT